MLVEHRGARPVIHPEAWVAPTAVVSGDVTIGAGCRILYGAVLTAEDGPVRLGENCVVMENAVLRGRGSHPLTIGRDVLVGPHAHLNGTTIGDACFLATGCSIFPGATLGRNVEVRINGVVHANTTLPDEALVPISWVAVGDPAEVLPSSDHDAIWAIQKDLKFDKTVYGDTADTTVAERMASQSQWFGAHCSDRTID